MIRNIAHACFTVSDLDRALRFYRDGLGLAEAFDFVNDEGHRFGVYLHTGGRNFLELFEGSLSEPADGQSYRHICLEVDDIEATVATLQDRGIEVSPVKLGRDHSYQAWLTDPDGNRIELHQYTLESWQAPSLD
ncbi:MAG: VOC family protein [Anaerolineae bacterium]|nr:VOC family protein [Anaerolineae bacterium]